MAGNGCARRTRSHHRARWAALILLTVLVTSAPGAVYIVSNTNDAAGGSLRGAIVGANANPGADGIIFSIPGAGPHTIQPLSPLPTITETVEIDGYSQTGASVATPSSPAVIMIELDGTLAGASTVGLDLFAPSCVIKGLCINRFGSHGIQIATYDGNVVVGNYIGTDTGGTLDRGNGGSGVYIYCADNSLIGYESPQDRNVICGNGRFGVEVEGNYSIRVTGTVIRANYIGIGANSYSHIGNDLSGVYTLYAHGNTIGGEDDNHPNTIAYNAWEGVRIWDSYSYNNAILRNSIFSNGFLGIDLYGDGVTPNDAGDGDGGANQLQNYPVLSSVIKAAGSTILQGTLNSTPSTQFRVEFFVSEALDPLGHGEGQAWLGYSNQTTGGAGTVAFTVTLPVVVAENAWITATATDPSGNTSEFSQGAMALLPQLSGAVAAGTLHLQWTAVPGALEYWVFGEPNHYYFDPDLGGMSNRVATLPSSQTTWSSANGIGDPDWNWTYQVVATYAGGFELARTNRFGEFGFGF